MDVVSILRQLWARRLLVTVGVAFAFLVADLVAFKVDIGVPPKLESRQYEVGVASAEVLVDSQRSQVIDLGGGPVRTDIVALTTRARLLANLMAASPMKEQIAIRAGIDPRTFTASAPSLAPGAPTPTSLDAGSVDKDANTMTVYFNETLPIVTADAQATDEATAARIAGAAITELGLYLKSVAAQDRVPDARQLVVKPLGPARFATVTRGERRLYAVLAFLFVLGAWCAAIVVSSRFARGWREAAAAEDDPDGGVGPSVVPAPAPAPTPEPAVARPPATAKQPKRSARTASAAPGEERPAAKERPPGKPKRSRTAA